MKAFIPPNILAANIPIGPAPGSPNEQRLMLGKNICFKIAYTV